MLKNRNIIMLGGVIFPFIFLISQCLFGCAFLGIILHYLPNSDSFQDRNTYCYLYDALITFGTLLNLYQIIILYSEKYSEFINKRSPFLQFINGVTIGILFLCVIALIPGLPTLLLTLFFGRFFISIDGGLNPVLYFISEISIIPFFAIIILMLLTSLSINRTLNNRTNTPTKKIDPLFFWLGILVSCVTVYFVYFLVSRLSIII